MHNNPHMNENNFVIARCTKFGAGRALPSTDAALSTAGCTPFTIPLLISSCVSSFMVFLVSEFVCIVVQKMSCTKCN